MYKPNDRNRPRTNERVAPEQLCFLLADPGLFHHSISSFHVHQQLGGAFTNTVPCTHPQTRSHRLREHQRGEVGSQTVLHVIRNYPIPAGTTIDRRFTSASAPAGLAALCPLLRLLVFVARVPEGTALRCLSGKEEAKVEWPLPVPRVCRGVRLVAHGKDGGNRTASKCQEVFLANPRRCPTYVQQTVPRCCCHSPPKMKGRPSCLWWPWLVLYLVLLFVHLSVGVAPMVGLARSRAACVCAEVTK